MKNKEQKIYAVMVKPYDHYDQWYYLSADEEAPTQFFETVNDICLCSFNEARTLCSNFSRRYPNKKFETVSKLSNNLTHEKD